MKTFVATHTGVVSGDARTGDKSLRVKLGQTPKYWVWIRQGKKFSKKNGSLSPRENWPMWHLHTETIKPILAQDEPEKRRTFMEDK